MLENNAYKIVCLSRVLAVAVEILTWRPGNISLSTT